MICGCIKGGHNVLSAQDRFALLVITGRRAFSTAPLRIDNKIINKNVKLSITTNSHSK
jgi:hypothetical protein